MRNSAVSMQGMFTWGHEGLKWPGDHEGMISCLMTKTSLSTLQVKLMWVGKKRAKSNRGEL